MDSSKQGTIEKKKKQIVPPVIDYLPGSYHSTLSQLPPVAVIRCGANRKLLFLAREVAGLHRSKLMGQSCQSLEGGLGKQPQQTEFGLAHCHSNQHQQKLKLVLIPQYFISFTSKEGFCKAGRREMRHSLLIK